VDFEQLKNHFDGRFDRLEDKLDVHDEKLTNHLERLSKAEEAIQWLRGHVKIVTTIGISVAGFLLTTLWNYVIKR